MTRMRRATWTVVCVLLLSSLTQCNESDLSDTEFLATLGLPEGEQNNSAAETSQEDPIQPDCSDGDGSNLSNEQFVQALLNGCKETEDTKQQRSITRCNRNRHTCTPYHKCSQEHIISDGAALFNLRILLREYEEAGEQVTHSDCRRLGEVCCTEPISDGGSIDVTGEQDSHPSCGKRNPDGVGAKIRNVSDKITQFGEIPWMCALIKVEKVTNHARDNNQDTNNDKPKHQLVFVAGCSLISERHVLTSAHNLELVHIDSGPVADSTLTVRLGEWDAKSDDEILEHKDMAVVHVHKHESFNRFSLIDDVAVLKLSSPVEMKAHIGTICLPAGGDLPSGECFATGWGKDRFAGGTFQTVLRRVPLTLVARKECERRLQDSKRLGKFFRLDESFVCAVGATRGDDTCTGDGGSPLVCAQEDGRYVQVGIVSWGLGCGQHHLPGVYTNVQQYTDWIQAHVNA